MKRTTSVSLGRCCFVLDEDAYAVLDGFLKDYRSALLKTESAFSVDEVVVDVEASQTAETSGQKDGCSRAGKKIYRDTERRAIGGVCSGLAYYLDTDVVLMRVIFIPATPENLKNL